ncbi:hypothetical protein ABZ869_08190 [Streptomyces sp. NPDC046928]|uniref:hypothetical protein n=1 Tax=Streptomyces sp. NPDC046928 TaxID=3155021 RepID=UPI0033E6DAA3
MSSTRAHRPALWSALPAALTALAACTAPDGSAGPERTGPAPAVTAALRQAERSTDRAASSYVESTTTLGSSLSMTARGTLAWHGPLTGTLRIRYTGGSTADTMRRLGTTSMEAHYLPDAYYARMGEVFAGRTDGRHWIRYAYDDLERLAGSSGADLADRMRDTAPHTSVKRLLASSDVRRVGEETVRGTRTTHYSGTVPGEGAHAQTVEIWVDDRDLLVKKVEKGRTATGALTQTAFYRDYGVGVTVSKPPAGDTADLGELLGSEPGS